MQLGQSLGNCEDRFAPVIEQICNVGLEVRYAVLFGSSGTLYGGFVHCRLELVAIWFNMTFILSRDSGLLDMSK